MEFEVLGRPLYLYLILLNLFFYQGMWAFISYRFILHTVDAPFRLKTFGIYMLLAFAVMLPEMVCDLPGAIPDSLFVLFSVIYLKVIFKRPLTAGLAVSLLVILLKGVALGFTAPLEHFFYARPLDLFQAQMFFLAASLVKIGVHGGLYWLLQRKVDFKSLGITRYTFIVILPPLLLILLWQVMESQATIQIDADKATIFSSLTMRDRLRDFLLSGIGFLCIFSVLLALQGLVSFCQWERERFTLLQQFSAWKNYIAEANDHIRQTRSFRHDLKNHLLVLQGLLEDGAIQEAKAYTEKINRAVTAASFAHYTGSAVLDALFNQKLGLAAQEGIQVKSEVKIPADFSVDDFDLCILFANAIDNALHACREAEEKYISLSTKRNGDFLLIEIKNSCGTAKGRPSGSGMGIPNMQAAARKYQGIVKTSEAGGYFCLTILLVASHKENCKGAKE